MRPQTIVERLDFVAKRIPGLKFTPPTQLRLGDDQFYGCFMSCDMYYIEIKVDQSHQSVKDVVISHGISTDGISCPVLRKVLADQDFETFAKHLAGLHSIYQINTNDKKVKQRAYPALTSLESDLSILYDHQRRRVVNCHDLVHKSPIGFMEPRKGGLPVRLTFFITPYDLVDTAQRKMISLNVKSIMDKSLGLSVTVEIEGSNSHKIQVKPLIMQTNSTLPAYAPFNGQNSEKLPAQFVLKLSQPFPMLITSINQIISEINEPTTIREYLNILTTSSKESIVTLIARQELDLNKGPFCRTVDSLRGADIESCDLKRHVYSVRLPDQAHTYHILDNYLEKPEGVYITKIPFTHPTSIPTILKILRQQALFNFVIGSCIRRNKQTNNPNTNIGEVSNPTTNNVQFSNIFDVTPVSLNSICISFEHPSKESLATLEIDFKELSCQLYALDKESVCSDEFATKVLQKCWSIPITLRSVLKKCDEKRLALLQDSNKRRERELQDLLTNNSSTQQGLQLKSGLRYQEAMTQSRFTNLNEKTNQRDLNSIAEFLSSKVSNASTSTGESKNDQTTSQSEPNNRTNLLKKFSCKPKVKQTTTTKSQSSNKILSLMLKRHSSNSSVSDDLSLKAPLTKKVKTKHSINDANSSESTLAPMTTKLITPEMAQAARLANKQAKHLASASNNQNVSLSLIRSPSKSQQATSISSSSSQSSSVNSTVLAPTPQGVNLKQSDSSGPRINDIINNIKINSQANGANVAMNSGAGKHRKSSIGALIDRLVGNVTPEQQQQLQQQQQTTNNQQSDSEVKMPNGPKNKSSRTPGGDQFAIKQGSSGSGLKLTVTKTKPSTPQSAANSTSIVSPTTPASSIQATNVNNSISVNKSEASSKTIDLVTSAASIRYTIPKISKTQQASQSSNTGNDNSNSNDSQVDESNPSSSGNTTLASSTTSTAAKQRTTSNPFKQTANANRNSVSSSTHPPIRTSSNPLANLNRSSSTSNSSSNNNIENNLTNRITSSSTSGGVNSGGLINQQVVNNIARQQQQAILNRSINLTAGSQQQQIAPAPIVPTLQQISNIQHIINPAILNQPQAQQAQQAQQLIRQQAPPMFSLRLPNQQNAFSNPNDLSLIVASQAAMLNQQKQLQIHQQQLLQQHLQLQSQPPQQSPKVSSSTEPGSTAALGSANAPPSSMAASNPSSPTECGQVETIAPPPLIPIDSLEDDNAVVQDDEDVHDDESDRLSIVDLNEGSAADCNSSAGTPTAGQVDVSMEVDKSTNSQPTTTSDAISSVTSPPHLPSSPQTTTTATDQTGPTSSLSSTEALSPPPATTVASSTKTNAVVAATSNE